MNVVTVDIFELAEFGIDVFTETKFDDNRGSLNVFFETSQRLKETNFFLTKKVSTTKQGVFRGLHIQKSPFKQKKISKVIEGKILQVFLNLDIHSKYFGQTIVATVSSKHNVTISVPFLFAHGFFALTAVTFEYICIGAYSEDHEISIDPQFLDLKMTISKKDLRGLKREDVIADIKSGILLI